MYFILFITVFMGMFFFFAASASQHECRGKAAILINIILCTLMVLATIFTLNQWN